MSDEQRVTQRIGADHPALPGHFPGHPLVPGVVLLECAAALAQARYGYGAPRGVNLLKFIAPVRPEQDFDCVLVAGERGRVAFRIELDGRIAAQGSLQFDVPDA
ncbi:hypothetical protein [Solimonas flava]|uniref:hypothetical protein n=1 Tax=Solimonas flava TaxID=415849 RepID=UPI000415391B|nr:hypothetical protein [Solimonas flava]